MNTDPFTPRIEIKYARNRLSLPQKAGRHRHCDSCTATKGIRLMTFNKAVSWNMVIVGIPGIFDVDIPVTSNNNGVQI